MRFCFIVEEKYRHEHMPMAVVEQLLAWKHIVDVLEPHLTVTSLSNFTKQAYDAYVLKTVSNGPGLSILEAAEAVGIPTINNSRSIRLVRDKAIAAAIAHDRGLPFPHTYFVTHPDQLNQIPVDDYPLVVKPTDGSSCRGIYRVDNPADLEKLEIAEAGQCYFLAQHYMENTGFDTKLYVCGTEVYAVAKRSPLHPDVRVDKRLIPVTEELRRLALNVGKIFGLDIYGLDVVETAQGFVVVDINDFPSFGQVPEAVKLVSSSILAITTRLKLQQAGLAIHMQYQFKALIEGVRQRFPLIRPVGPGNGSGPTSYTSDLEETLTKKNDVKTRSRQ